MHSDFAWADVVFVGGMHIQLPEVRDIQRRAKSCGKLTVLGGSAVSSSPETYPEFDYLHLGEIGDATDELIATLDESLEPPVAQRRFETRERLPLSSFPLPRLRCRAARALSHRLPAILQWLPISVRILRYSGPVWPPAALQVGPSNFLPNSTPSSPNRIIRR